MKTSIVLCIALVLSCFANVYQSSTIMNLKNKVHTQDNKIQLADMTIDMLYRILLEEGIIEDVDGILDKNNISDLGE